MSSPLAAEEARASGARATEQRRLRILAAAADCFAKNGFAKTRIEHVAADAGVSRALVYHHFGSKRELAQKVQDHMLEEWSAAANRAIEGAATAGQALEAWMRVNLLDTKRGPLLSAILAEDAAPVLVGWAEAAHAAMEEWRTKLVALLEQGIANGEFRSDLDVESTAEALRAMQVGMMQHLLSDPPLVDVSGVRHVRAAIDLILSGLRHPTSD